MSEEDIPLREKLLAAKEVALYRPKYTVLLVTSSFFSAFLDGVGVSFLIPIIEVAQSGDAAAVDASGLMGLFVDAYQIAGIPFTLEYIIVGVTAVITGRYVLSFVTAWAREYLRADYTRYIRQQIFEHLQTAQIAFIDEVGSDDVLNAAITQTEYAGRSVSKLVRLMQAGLVSVVYLGLAFFLSSYMTIVTIAVLGGITVLIRHILEPGYTVGDRLANANEQIQSIVQTSSQGSRDVRLFSITNELNEQFKQSIDKYFQSLVKLQRNKAAISQLYRLSTALMVFLLIYGAVRFTSLGVGGLGAFLFAMFRLAPRVSNINKHLYQLEGDLPHVIRTHEFMTKLREHQEIDTGREPAPDSVERLAFENVGFAYNSEESVLEDISFNLESGETVALVGESGAGKSTIISLVVRLYDPDEGAIMINDVPLTEIDLNEWRSKLAVVRQNPYIFDESLRYNLTVGNRNASEKEIQRVCDIAQVSEFLSELPKGFNTRLGDDGVQLSGGQRQRVALARALLKDADVLVLDEATSSLDSNIQQLVLEGIREANDDYLTLMISHQISTVKDADLILTIEDGVVTEAGIHETLVSSGGKYNELHLAQSGANSG
ncbi:ABC transporter ATP-binding protein [Halobacterium bonnevillei]|uniref:ATP-binding cassette domain-containing protein n=1 Tax=Halobacterium bonnevillei TaxID=2692200 RepID=A0A6B0SEB7_9EURY|nr:ABC transporter ATP-binding protein [Halobacterium bonnevillei]MXR19066.1 ATP-binding cassette domain-containing protein [Halobacterium bonnevillei]